MLVLVVFSISGGMIRTCVKTPSGSPRLIGIIVHHSATDPGTCVPLYFNENFT